MIGITDKEFKLIATYLKNNFGINLNDEKKGIVTSRLYSDLNNIGLKDFSEYYEYIVSDKTGAAAVSFINKITTNHTYFMREPEHFTFFQKSVIPYLVQNVKDGDLRIWCAACSTGEESYTIAMILDEYFGKDKLFWDKKVLATDISEKALSTAMEGRYKTESILSLPLHWRENYFKAVDKEYSIVKPILKNEVIYRKFNLVEPVFPFKKKMHAIFCRNVMIYFDQETKDELVLKLYNQLEPGGYLFIGHSESINRGVTPLKYIMPSVYRKE